MRITFLTTSFPQDSYDVSGTFVYRLARELARAGVAISVIAPGSVRGSRQERMEGMDISRPRYSWPPQRQRLCYAHGIPQNVRSRPGLVFQAFPLGVVMLVEALRRSKETDVFHAHWTFAGLVAGVAGFLTRTPIVITIWGSDVRLLPRLMNRWILKRARTVVGLSAEMHALAREIGIDVVSIPAPIDTDRFQPNAGGMAFRREIGIPPSSPVALFVGRLSAEKDPETFIRAFALARRRHPDLEGVIVGDGPLRGYLEDLIRLEDLVGSLRLVGARPDVERALSAATVAVALSRIENVWSTTIAEAAAVGVPMVITDAGHTDEIFSHGVDALLVEPGSPSAVSEAILQVVKDPQVAWRLVEGARTLHSRHGFDSSSIVARHLNIYRDALT